MRTIAFIFARGGSRGIPNKNLQKIGGTSLVCRAVETALTTTGIERAIISTDSAEIAAAAVASGAEQLFLRPSELATDTAAERDAWQHAVEFVQDKLGQFDCFLSVPPTAPLRTKEDIERVLEEYHHHHPDLVITATPARRHPFFNMITMDRNGWASAFGNSTPHFDRRQDVPEAFDMTTVAYAANPSFVLSDTRLLHGRVRCVLIPAERAIDIDSPLDLEIARFLERLRNETE